MKSAQRSCAPSLSSDMNQMIQSSAAMTATMLGDAEVMPGLGPVPLLQRQSASESRWKRPVPTSREAAEGGFPNRPFLGLTIHQNESRPPPYRAGTPTGPRGGPISRHSMTHETDILLY